MFKHADSVIGGVKMSIVGVIIMTTLSPLSVTICNLIKWIQEKTQRSHKKMQRSLDSSRTPLFCWWTFILFLCFDDSAEIIFNTVEWDFMSQDNFLASFDPSYCFNRLPACYAEFLLPPIRNTLNTRCQVGKSILAGCGHLTIKRKGTISVIVNSCVTASWNLVGTSYIRKKLSRDSEPVVWHRVESKQIFLLQFPSSSFECLTLTCNP